MKTKEKILSESGTSELLATENETSRSYLFNELKQSGEDCVGCKHVRFAAIRSETTAEAFILDLVQHIFPSLSLTAVCSMWKGY